jgi:hypothetical protein
VLALFEMGAEAGLETLLATLGASSCPLDALTSSFCVARSNDEATFLYLSGYVLLYETTASLDA